MLTMKKIPTPYITKNQLLDYVTKNDFNEFKTDVFKRFDAIDARFDAVDKRMGSLDQRMSTLEKGFIRLEDNMRIQAGVYYERMEHNFKAGMEILKEIAAGRVSA
jgi:hypothetical protein